MAKWCSQITSHYFMGFRWASDHVYTLQEVVQVSASNRTCSSLPLPPPPPLAGLGEYSIEAGEYLAWVSQCDGAWWWLLVSVSLWIPALSAQGLHFAWHNHPPSQTPSRSSSIGNELNFGQWASGVIHVNYSDFTKEKLNPLIFSNMSSCQN